MINEKWVIKSILQKYIFVGFSLWLGACNESSFGLDIVIMQ